MNKLQQVEFYILESFDEACKKNGIKYSLAYGTALGAVRHKGFIPWDDDIDVYMQRNEYEIFRKMATDILPSDLFFQAYDTDPEYPLPFAKIRKRGTAFVENGRGHLNMHQGIFIDVFVLDNVSLNPLKKFLQGVNADLMWITMAKGRNWIGKKKVLVSLLNLGLSNDEKYVRRLKKYEEKIIKYSEPKSEVLRMLGYGSRSKYAKQRFEKKDLEIIEIPFEHKHFLIMQGYDKYLTGNYGDYMTPPPKEQQIGLHDYEYLSFTDEYIQEKL